MRARLPRGQRIWQPLDSKAHQPHLAQFRGAPVRARLPKGRRELAPQRQKGCRPWWTAAALAGHPHPGLLPGPWHKRFRRCPPRWHSLQPTRRGSSLTSCAASFVLAGGGLVRILCQERICRGSTAFCQTEWVAESSSCVCAGMFCAQVILKTAEARYHQQPLQNAGQAGMRGGSTQQLKSWPGQSCSAKFIVVACMSIQLACWELHRCWAGNHQPESDAS